METLNTINDFLWTYVIIAMLVACALYFTIRTKFVQFRLFFHMIKLMFSDNDDDCEGTIEQGSESKKVETIPTPENIEQKPKTKKIGSFQAFAVALSSRVGTGNLAGVASAIFVGGPGAVFWMWIMALLGSATAFVEATLAQLYKKRGAESYYGGPAYYMQQGLGQKWMGVLFAILITITFGMANQVVQSNTLCDAISDTFASDKVLVGVILTIATLIIIFGGIQRISRFASICVPIMAVGYLILSVVIICMNITELPKVLQLIVDSAFGVGPMAGGAVGAAVMQGVKRGLFSNEAGEGSAPNAAAIADTSHPVKQGLIQALGVFTDTILICTCTAAIILLSGLYDSGADGIILTTRALESEIGVAGRYFITAAIFLFAFSTIIANYFYGETNIRFITSNRWAVFAFRLITGGTVIYGAFLSLQEAFAIVDICMGLMTVTNMVAVFLLSPKVFKLLKNYEQQRRAKKNPIFHRDMLGEDVDCWE